MAWQMRRDTAANWTSVDPVLAEGEPGFDTTNNEIRIGNGTDVWSALDPISGGDATSTSITVPEDHGAQGDGTTDDTTALQAWLDDSRPFKFLPASTYVTDYLDVSADTTIMGPGTLKLRGQTLDVEGGVLNIKGTSGAPITGVVVSGITVDGNKANVTVTSPADSLNVECIDIEHAEGVRFHNLTVRAAVSDGLDVDNATDCVIYASHAYDCGGWGFHFSHSADANKLLDCVADNCGHDQSRGGVDQWDESSSGDGGTNNSFIGNTARDCHRNYAIEGSGAVFIGNQSLGTTVEDDITTGVSDFGGDVDLSFYPSAEGQPAGKVAQTVGDDTWEFIDTPTGGGGVWMPLTTVVGGEPELVWDDDNSLIPTEVPT